MPPRKQAEVKITEKRPHVSVLGPRVRVAEIVRRAVVEGVEIGTTQQGGGLSGMNVTSRADRRRIVDAVIDELREVLELEGA